MSDFGDRLTNMCAAEVTQASGNSERLLEVIVRLGSNLSTTLAYIGHHDPDARDRLLKMVCEAIVEGANMPLVPKPGAPLQ